MKKTYFTPEMTVVKMNPQPLMDTTIPASGFGNGGGEDPDGTTPDD